jgi:hypothetical protein
MTKSNENGILSCCKLLDIYHTRIEDSKPDTVGLLGVLYFQG